MLFLEFLRLAGDLRAAVRTIMSWAVRSPNVFPVACLATMSLSGPALRNALQTVDAWESTKARRMLGALELQGALWVCDREEASKFHVGPLSLCTV